MGYQVLDIETNELEGEVESSYRLKTFLAKSFPKDYMNAVIAPFLNSLRYGNDLFKLIDQETYFQMYKKYIDTLLNREEAMIKLAQLSDGTILGWCLYENKTVHYIWVKDHQRRNGIGRSLLPKEFDTITHITNKGINIWVNKFPEVKFNPWA